MDEVYERIYRDPEFQALARRRSRFSWTLAALMLVSYFAFILVIAFAPGLFAVPLAAGSVITRGIPIGVAIIVFGFVLTGVYVWRANGEFDRASADIVRRLGAPR